MPQEPDRHYGLDPKWFEVDFEIGYRLMAVRAKAHAVAHSLKEIIEAKSSRMSLSVIDLQKYTVSDEWIGEGVFLNQLKDCSWTICQFEGSEFFDQTHVTAKPISQQLETATFAAEMNEYLYNYIVHTDGELLESWQAEGESIIGEDSAYPAEAIQEMLRDGYHIREDGMETFFTRRDVPFDSKDGAPGNVQQSMCDYLKLAIPFLEIGLDERRQFLFSSKAPDEFAECLLLTFSDQRA